MKKIRWISGIILLFVGLSACDKNDFETNKGLNDTNLKGVVLEPVEAGNAFAYGTHVFTSNPVANPDGLESLNLTKNRWGWSINQNITLKPATTVTDVDGNVYKTVKIGEQTWMAENLRVAHNNDGSDIYQSWMMLFDPVYGGYYNPYLIGNAKLAPIGWRIPTIQDWLQLQEYIGGYTQGYKLKEAGNDHWTPPLPTATTFIQATDEYGFTALPAGRNILGSSSIIRNKGTHAYFLSSTPESYNYCGVFLSYTNNTFNTAFITNSTYGFSIRCIKEEADDEEVGTTELPIYMDASLNDTTKGTQVGIAYIEYDGDELKVKYDLFDEYTMNEVHIYAKDTVPATIAPGQFGFTEMFNEPVGEFETIFNFEDAENDGIWLILHAVIAL